MSKRELVAEMGYEDAIVFENPDYDDAIIGVSSDGRVVYDYDLMVQCLVREGMSQDEAVDFIDYNTIRALGYAGPEGPVVVYKLMEV